MIRKNTGASERYIDRVAKDIGVPPDHEAVGSPWFYPSLAGDYGFGSGRHAGGRAEPLTCP